ncbi:hypothetical protein VNO78_24739 [Psophocarpus tetragonolobus]|uniref:Non-haem dioxygenase N-terminal domain-containing protein n=1 Tax=Psophocarpus tetragonolobus TaxID=3891 RepID=A0AAN9S8W5_PSOTE
MFSIPVCNQYDLACCLRATHEYRKLRHIQYGLDRFGLLVSVADVRTWLVEPKPMLEIPVDFRAPPPSPVASGRRSSVSNDEVLTELLEASVRVPELVLPDKLFPKQKEVEAPPEVDFVSLCFHRDEALRDVVSESLASMGCFQLLNHGIPLALMGAAADAAGGVFDVPAGKRASATRSAERPWGFEEGEESEEFVWCNEEALKSNLEEIWGIGYRNFSEKMEKLMGRIEMVGREMEGVILEKEGSVGGSVCCVYKQNKNGNMNGCWKYDVIRMLIRGADYSHSFCFHICNGSSLFHVYSKKTWLSFSPHPAALLVTAGDQTQIFTRGRYKHVIAMPLFQQDTLSMAFLFSTPNTNSIREPATTISLAHQAFFAFLLYHLIFFLTL